MANVLDELRQYAEKHKVSNLENAKHYVIPVVQDVVQKIKSYDDKFNIAEIEYTGSIYQKLKIDDPDEFDFDLPLSELEIEEVSNISQEYAKYQLKSNQHAWNHLADSNGMLSSERVLQTFASYVTMAVNDLNREKRYPFTFDLKTDHPAVTLKFLVQGVVLYNVDLVPTIKVKNWPDKFTLGWESRSRNGWPNADILNEIKLRGVSLVPKLPKGMPINARNIAWRYSFNKAEKVLLLDSEPSIANNCRRPVLRILKSLHKDYMWSGIRSYHLKTVLLHEFESHHPSYWTSENMFQCLKKALERLRSFLDNKNCPHYFLPGINLFVTLSEQDRDKIVRDIREFLADPKGTLEKLNGKASKDFQIFVTDLNGKTMPIIVKNETTIDQLKNIISTKKGIEKSQFQLLYSGHYLQSGTIESEGIRPGCTIQMQGRLRGG